MKKVATLGSLILIVFIVFCQSVYPAWFDYEGITKHYEDFKNSSLSLALPKPYVWKPASLTLFTLDTHGGWDLGYNILFDLEVGEGIDVAQDGYSCPQLMSKFDLKFGAGAWIELTSPSVEIDFGVFHL